MASFPRSFPIRLQRLSSALSHQLAAAFAVVPVTTPGALTVDTAARSEQPCTVTTVSISCLPMGALKVLMWPGVPDTRPTGGHAAAARGAGAPGDGGVPWVPVPVVRFHPRARLPVYASELAAA